MPTPPPDCTRRYSLAPPASPGSPLSSQPSSAMRAMSPNLSRRLSIGRPAGEPLAGTQGQSPTQARQASSPFPHDERWLDAPGSSGQPGHPLALSSPAASAPMGVRVRGGLFSDADTAPALSQRQAVMQPAPAQLVSTELLTSSQAVADVSVATSSMAAGSATMQAAVRAPHAQVPSPSPAEADPACVAEGGPEGQGVCRRTLGSPSSSTTAAADGSQATKLEDVRESMQQLPPDVQQEERRRHSVPLPLPAERPAKPSVVLDCVPLLRAASPLPHPRKAAPQGGSTAALPQSFLIPATALPQFLASAAACSQQLLISAPTLAQDASSPQLGWSPSPWGMYPMQYPQPMQYQPPYQQPMMQLPPQMQYAMYPQSQYYPQHQQYMMQYNNGSQGYGPPLNGNQGFGPPLPMTPVSGYPAAVPGQMAWPDMFSGYPYQVQSGSQVQGGGAEGAWYPWLGKLSYGYGPPPPPAQT